MSRRYISKLASSIHAALRLLLLTGRGRRTVVTSALAVFGGLSGFIQLWSALFVPDDEVRWAVWILLVVLAGSVAAALTANWPRRSISRRFEYPDTRLTIKVGDIFESDTQIVVGFSDTFDTDTTDDRVISRRSLLGQLIERWYGGDPTELDVDLAGALSTHSPVAVADPGKEGKRERYPVGTVAVLKPADRDNVYGLAYGEMGDDLVNRSSVNHIWHSLESLWDAVYANGQHRTVTMPVIGTKLARIDSLRGESILKMIALSYVARSRESKLCSEFVIVVSEDDWKSMNPLALKDFLKSL